MDKAIVLHNNTSSVIKINSLSFSPAGVFRMSALQNGNTILPGKLLPISIVFTPPSVGAHTSSVIINTYVPNITATFSVSGSGVNIQPNWLGVYNELENNPELSQIFKRFRLFEIYLNDQTLIPIKICADGSKATVFKFTNNNPNLNTRDVVFRIKNDENESNPDFKGRF
jgi:hypothetical protein